MVKPLVHQQAHEIQPYGHLIRMPIALAESACQESVSLSKRRFGWP
jgi:starvation-inducible DNA-binding protein